MRNNKGQFTKEKRGPLSDSTKDKIRQRMKGNKNPKGSKRSMEHRKRIGETHSGANCYFWKGGISPINKRIRGSLEYKLWREAVYKRDNYTCKFCGNRGGKLSPDHIKPFCNYPELRFAIDNGRTLCHDCHKKTDTYGSKMLTYRKNNGNRGD